MEQLKKAFNFLLDYPFENGEIFKEIPGTKKEGTYFVSNKGKVLSLYKDKYIILTPDLSTKYERVKINGKNKLIHRLVAQAFIDNPKAKKEVHHKDLNTRNNCVENLEWLTQSEHRKKHQEQKTNEKI